MPSVPRIVRAAPRGPVTRPEQGIPVNVLIRWHSGEEVTVPAVATAWTQDAVEITWEAPELGLRSDWIPAGDVSRPDARGRRAQSPPRNRTGTPKPRW
jgi:hypothetical protein